MLPVASGVVDITSSPGGGGSGPADSLAADGASARPARELWAAAETLHAVTYFHQPALDAIASAGARGFWMGYFAARLAPMGPVGPEVATAVCNTFAPSRTHRALPDAWDYLSPTIALEARLRGAVGSLAAAGVAEPDEELLDLLDRIVAALPLSGRPLGAANVGLPAPPDPTGRLWQACTTLREHRGDGHVALLVGAGLHGCRADVLVSAVRGQDPTIHLRSRGWTDEEWAAAVDELVGAGLVDAAGHATVRGRELHAEVEARTDALAIASYAPVLDAVGVGELAGRLAALAAPVQIPQPNPIGLARG